MDIHMGIYIRIEEYIHAHKYVYIYIYIYINMYKWIRVYIYIYIYIISTCIPVLMHMRIPVSMFICDIHCTCMPMTRHCSCGDSSLFEAQAIRGSHQ